ncbi:beta strand repeat-containing protein [Aeromonas veronii]
MNKPNYFLKHLCSLMIFTIFCLFLAGCNPNGAFSAPQGNNDKKLVSIQISPADITTQGTSNLSIAKGNSQPFIAIAKYSDGTIEDITASAVWSISDDTVATIDRGGFINGINPGVTSINISMGGISSNTVSIAVTDAILTSLQIVPHNPTTFGVSALTLAKGNIQRLMAIGTYSDGTTANVTGMVAWLSVNTGIVTVSNKGWASAAGVGNTQVSASLLGVHSNDVSIAVTSAVLTSIQIAVNDITTQGVSELALAKGNQQSLIATGSYSDGTTTNITNMVTWHSTDSATVAVTSEGVAKGIGIGLASVSASQNGIGSNEISMKVTKAVLTTIQVSPGDIVTRGVTEPSLAKGNSQYFIAIGTYSDGTTATLTNHVLWQSAVTSIITVTTHGRITGMAEGSSQISASLAGINSNKVDVTVTAATLTNIVVIPGDSTTQGLSDLSLAKGNTQQFSVLGVYSDGTTFDITNSVAWHSDSPNVVTVNNNGLITGANTGNSSITVSMDGITSPAIEVKVTDAILTKIQVTPTAASLAKGFSQSLRAIGIYSDNTTSDISNRVAWRSNNTSMVTVTTTGLATGMGVGITTVTASMDGTISNNAVMTVTAAVLTGIQVTPSILTTSGVSNLTLAKGNAQKLTAMGTYSDGTAKNITDRVAWYSTDITRVTITINGLAKAVGIGDTTLRASLNDISSNSITVTVTNALLTHIQITVNGSTTQGVSILSLAKGNNQQLAAIGTYTDGTTANITNEVAWNSDNSDAATVNTKGLATGVELGITNITANLDNIGSNNLTLTVTNAVLMEIQVTPAVISVANGNSQMLQATGKYSDKTTADITSRVAWLSGDTSIATVTNEGRATGVAIGTTTITAVRDGITSNTVNMTVTTAVLTKIKVIPATISVAKGNSQQLMAIGTYSDGSVDDITQAVAWGSVDSNLVTVTSDGMATGAAIGVTTITARQKGLISNTVNMTVTAAVLTEIQVTPATISVAKGYGQSLSATGTYSDGSVDDITDFVAWNSTDTHTVTITKQGFARGVEIGDVTITAARDGVTSTPATMRVTAAALTEIQVTPSTISVPKGNNEQLTAVGTYSDGTVDDITYMVMWDSDDINTVTVTPTGLAAGIEVGNVSMTAVLDGITSNTVSMEVTTAMLTDIQVTPSFISVAKGNSQLLTAIGTYSDGTAHDITQEVEWDSTDASIVTVTLAGLATGVSVGNAAITASQNGIISNVVSMAVTTAVLTEIQVTPSTISVAKGNSQSLTAIGTYSDGTAHDITQEVAWDSVDNSVVTVTADGVATGITIGATTVNASQGNIGSNTVNITVTGAVLTDIQVTPTHPSVAKGNTQALTATGTYSDGSLANITNTVAWDSADTSKVTVSVNGLATGVSIGSTTVVARQAGLLSNTVNMTVTEAVLTNIAVTPVSTNLAKGNSQVLVATGTYSDATTVNISSSVAWNSANTGIVTVNASGVATGSGVGSTTVIATRKGVTSNSVNITVTAALLTTIAVTPSNSSVAKGRSQALTATGTYSDATTVNISSSVAWKSANTGIATVNPSGVATGVEMGNTTLTATLMGITSNAVSMTVTIPISPVGICGGAVNNTSQTNAADACLKVTSDNSGRWFTGTPSLAAMNLLGYIQQGGDGANSKTYVSTHTEAGTIYGPNGETFALFDQRGGTADGVGGQYDRWCQDLASMYFAGKGNWRRTTSDELQGLVTDRGSLWTNFGWSTYDGYTSSTKTGTNFIAIFMYNGGTFPGGASVANPAYGSCVSP